MRAGRRLSAFQNEVPDVCCIEKVANALALGRKTLLLAAGRDGRDKLLTYACHTPHEVTLARNTCANRVTEPLLRSICYTIYDHLTNKVNVDVHSERNCL